MLRGVLVGLLAMSCAGCVTKRSGGHQDRAILNPSSRSSTWPVAGETVPGVWFRLESGPNSPPVNELVENLTLTIEHSSRQQVITGAAFAPIADVTGLHQTRYMYLPRSGTLFVTLSLRAVGRQFFPDTQRIELNDDCWHMLSYRIRGPINDGLPYPPPYPRTVFLTAALSQESRLYLEVTLSGNCFKNPLPPH